MSLSTNSTKPSNFTKNGIALAIAALVCATASVAKDRTAIRKAGLIWLDTNSCAERISSDLEDAGFSLADRHEDADSVLRVNVHQLDAHTGASARYAASMREVDGRTFFNTDGREDAISEKRLCRDISVRIVDRVETRLASES